MPALATAALAASLVFHMRRDALQLSGHSVTELVLKDGDRCELILRNGETLAGTIEGSTFVAPLLMVINVRPEGRGRRRSAILMPDSAPAENLRSARVWLRHRVQLDSPTSGPP
jgi:toxin CptA